MSRACGGITPGYLHNVLLEFGVSGEIVIPQAAHGRHRIGRVMGGYSIVLEESIYPLERNADGLKLKASPLMTPDASCGGRRDEGHPSCDIIPRAGRVPQATPRGVQGAHSWRLLNAFTETAKKYSPRASTSARDDCPRFSPERLVDIRR
jgi:hypothetical protein